MKHTMSTALTRMLQIERPIIQAGMIWVSGWKLAAAACKSGILGVIGAGSMDPKVLQVHLNRMGDAVGERPWAVNLPLFFKHADTMAKQIIASKARVVISSGGSPNTFTSIFKDADMTVLHVTAHPQLAIKCQQAGVDGVIVEGYEAGGHNGRDELTTMVLVPQSVDAVNIPVIAAGGIYDGRGMAAALALGACGVQIGTRFAACRESSAHPAFKQAMCDADASATTLLLRKLMPVRVIKNNWALRVMDAEQRGADEDSLRRLLGRGRSHLGMFEGDLHEGELEIGQAVAAIRHIEPIAEVVTQIMRDCCARLNSMTGSCR